MTDFKESVADARLFLSVFIIALMQLFFVTFVLCKMQNDLHTFYSLWAVLLKGVRKKGELHYGVNTGEPVLTPQSASDLMVFQSPPLSGTDPVKWHQPNTVVRGGISPPEV